MSVNINVQYKLGQMWRHIATRLPVVLRFFILRFFFWAEVYQNFLRVAWLRLNTYCFFTTCCYFTAVSRRSVRENQLLTQIRNRCSLIMLLLYIALFIVIFIMWYACTGTKQAVIAVMFGRCLVRVFVGTSAMLSQFSQVFSQSLHAFTSVRLRPLPNPFWFIINVIVFLTLVVACLVK